MAAIPPTNSGLLGAVMAAGALALVASDGCAERACGVTQDWAQRAEVYEYTASANPPMAEVPVRIFGPQLHREGPSRVEVMDLSGDLALDYPATAPNLLASFVRVLAGEALPTGVDHASSQLFYVIRGRGSSVTRAGELEWKEGDLFTVPYLGDNATRVCSERSQCVLHRCAEEPHFGGCALYWVHDGPLLKYLGVRPLGSRRFDPALYPGDMMRESVASIPDVDGAGRVRNRRGILLGNPSTPQTKTATPTLWSLLNTIGPKAAQEPHKHNSVALDMAVSAGQAGTVYTLLGRSLNATGAIVDPTRVEWQSGGVFVTPPGWWHSHHNAGDAEAWVLPVQDAGLYTHQRTLDIRFADQAVTNHREGVIRGATQPETQAEAAPPLRAGTIVCGHT